MTKLVWSLRLLMLALSPLLNPREATAQSPAVAIVGATVVTMDRDRVIRDATIVARDGRIVTVGARASVSIPAGARRVDGRGKWVMPGLVDAHIHLTEDDSVNRQLLTLGLVNGVTTVIELAGSPASLRIRDAIRSGRIAGPTIYTAGPVANDRAMTKDDGIRFVEEHHAAGYDLIKVYNELSKEGYRGILVRADELGMPVVGHVVRAIDLEGTLGSGQRGIVHMEEYLYTYFSYRNSDTLVAPGAKFEPQAIPYLAKHTKDAGIWVTPTLAMFESIADQAENVAQRLARPENRYVPEAVYRRSWAADSNGYARRFNRPQHVQNLRAAVEFQKRMTREFHAAGVPLLAGTDAPTPAAVPGFGLHDELATFASLGLSTRETIATATRNAAEYLGRDREFGTLAAGKRADLLLLEADPLANVANAKRISGVMSGGRWLAKGELAAMLDALRRP